MQTKEDTDIFFLAVENEVYGLIHAGYGIESALFIVQNKYKMIRQEKKRLNDCFKGIV